MWIGEECMSFEEWVLMLLRSYIKNESIEIKNIDYDLTFKEKIEKLNDEHVAELCSAEYENFRKMYS